MIYAIVLFAFSHLLKVFRLYYPLYQFNTPFMYLVLVNFCGVLMSYYLGVPIYYELFLVEGVGIYSIKFLFPTLYSIVILRLFDSFILCCLLLISNVQPYDSLVFLFLSVVLMSTFLLFTIPRLLSSAERNILSNGYNNKYIIMALLIIHKAKKDLEHLSWNKKETIFIIFLITLLAWFAEWLALYCLSQSSDIATHSLFGRIGFSFRLTALAENYYDTLMPVLGYGALLSGFLCLILKGNKHE